MASAGKLLKVHGKRFGNIADEIGSSYSALGEHQYFVSPNQVYQDLTASNLSFTTSASNSIFLLQVDINVYITPDNGNGSNAAFKWNGVKICGTDGGSGDTWQRCGHGSSGNGGACNMIRKLVYSPGLPSGTSVLANVMIGKWSSDEARVNYNGHSCYCDFIIMEFSAT